MKNHFIIIIGSYNNSQWVSSNINSIILQDYINYEVRYFDDASDDDTLNEVKKLTKHDPKFNIFHSNKRQYKSWFFYNLIDIKDNDVLIFLDGDDMFYCENVLSYLNEVYNKSNCWMTYGGMLVWNNGNFVSEPFPQNSEIPENIKVKKLYRKDVWRTSHLKSLRGFLWNNFNKEDLIFNGLPIVGPDDLAIMFSMLEMTPPSKIFRIPEPLYLYNLTPENQYSRALADNKSIGINYEIMIRSKKSYDTLSCVVPTLVGGLGNQIFEIAAAAALAKDNNAILLVNNNEHICPNQGRNVNNYINNIFSKIALDTDPIIENFYNESGCLYKFIPYKQNIKLGGHFQSWKYFHHQQNYIRNLFSPTKEIQEELDEKFSWLKNCTAIQVRRGDALTERAVGYHPVPTLEYFYEAVNRINPSHIVVFSDDMKWCKENLKFNVHCDFSISQGEYRDYMEIYMMSLCKNIIISNSTFGWWGAYLNARIDKKVYVPSMWFGPKITQRGFDINELILPDWIQI